MDFPPIQLNERNLGVEVIMTKNRNAYARVRNNNVVISIPSRMDRESAHKVAANLYARIKKDILSKPERYLYPGRKEEISIHDGEQIAIMGRTFDMHVSSSSAARARGALKGSSLIIEIPESWNAGQKERSTSRLARRILSRELKNKIEERVSAFNAAHFNSGIRQIKLTNASTRWGSCTTSGRLDGAVISLNFKLLFMPMECLDYVIVHELAHTRIHNHTKAFWNIVGGVMPDYKERRNQLKQSAYRLKLGRAI